MVIVKHCRFWFSVCAITPCSLYLVCAFVPSLTFPENPWIALRVFEAGRCEVFHCPYAFLPFCYPYCDQSLVHLQRVRKNTSVAHTWNPLCSFGFPYSLLFLLGSIPGALSVRPPKKSVPRTPELLYFRMISSHGVLHDVANPWCAFSEFANTPVLHTLEISHVP